MVSSLCRMLLETDTTETMGQYIRASTTTTRYLRPNLHRKNLHVLTEAHATKVLLEGDRTVGVEFAHSGKKHAVSAKKEVVLSAGTIQTQQLLELSGIGDPDVLKKAGVQCKVENKWVGANFQDHVLGGMLFDCKDGVLSLDELHSEEYAQAQQEIYNKTHDGPYGSPGMLMGFVSYTSLVGEAGVKETIKAIEANSLPKTKFEKAQEKVSVRSHVSLWLLNRAHALQVIIDQLADLTFANL
jgi:choline dehydrogenase-like flavoprotein